jgi:hypothetical protein
MLLLVEGALKQLVLCEALLCCLPIDNVPNCGEIFGLAILILEAMHISVLDEMHDFRTH